MTKKAGEFFGVIVRLAVSLALMPWTAFVLVHLWTWFAAPLGAPVLHKAHAMGLSLLVEYMSGLLSLSMRFTYMTQKAADEESPWLPIWHSVYLSLAVLGLGAVFHSLMTP